MCRYRPDAMPADANPREPRAAEAGADADEAGDDAPLVQAKALTKRFGDYVAVDLSLIHI